MRVRYWLPWLAISLIVHVGVAAAFGERAVVRPPEPIPVALEPISIRRATPRPPVAARPRPSRRPSSPPPVRAASSPPQASPVPSRGTARAAPRSRLPVHTPAVPAAPVAPAVPASGVPATPLLRRAPAPPAVPSLAPAPTATSAPAAPAAPAGESSNAWLAAVAARLERYKTYPNPARNRGEQGTAYVDVTVDRAGNVLAASLATSSGWDALDAAAVELVRRATPLPTPPPAVQSGQARISVVVPIAFSLQ